MPKPYIPLVPNLILLTAAAKVAQQCISLIPAGFFFDLDVIFNRQDLSPRFRVQSSKKERLCLTQFCLTSVHKKEDKTGGRNNCLWDQHTWYKEKVSENAVLLLKN